MAKGPASLQRRYWKAGRTLVNTDELEQVIYMAERRVLEIQAKLHRWAGEASSCRFDDLYNLVCDIIETCPPQPSDARVHRHDRPQWARRQNSGSGSSAGSHIGGSPTRSPRGRTLYDTAVMANRPFGLIFARLCVLMAH